MCKFCMRYAIAIVKDEILEYRMELPKAQGIERAILIHSIASLENGVSMLEDLIESSVIKYKH